MTTNTMLSSASSSTLASKELAISADSHVLEPRDLWTDRLPVGLRERVPQLPNRREDKPGATDPADRLGVMQRDSVSMEVLYPTYALTQFGMEDQELQEACFRVYNDWLVEYCAATPGRLVGIPCISTYDIQHAVNELERCAAMGLKGALVWHVPHPDLPFTSNHYDPLWDAAGQMDMPVNLHILTGFSYSRNQEARQGVETYRGSVGWKLIDAINTMFDFIFHGVLHRYPNLKIVLAENEMGWVPWVLQQWDYYARRFGERNPLPGGIPPSESFNRQVYFTFFNDGVGARAFQWGWGVDNCMWSNDFPHGNTTWPNSREIIARDLSMLPDDVRARLLRENVARLYNLTIPAPIDA
ncbi:MAG TPA: amidohydrolase family protein [Chloroflexota bacterium]|nr:amidohydrolase family protein [Chloroflexota bacterium]